MQQVDSKIKPLISDLENTHIDYYLATSTFERLSVKHGFDSMWDNFFRDVERKRRVHIMGGDHKRWDSKDALILFLDSAFRQNREIFDQLVYIILMGFIDWNRKIISLENIFSDLEILNFPKEWLIEIREIYEAKNQELKDLKEKKLIEEKKEKESKKDFLAIWKTKRVEWINDISMAQTEKAIMEMKSFALEISNDDLVSDIVNQSQRWYRLQSKIRNNVLDSDKEQIECNKINKALLDIINEFKLKII